MELPAFLDEWRGQTNSDFYAVAELLWETGAMECRYNHHWEGDIRNGPYVFMIPKEGTMEPGLVWKQDNNGNTFVVTLTELPWMEGLGEKSTVTLKLPGRWPYSGRGPILSVP